MSTNTTAINNNNNSIIENVVSIKYEININNKENNNNNNVDTRNNNNDTNNNKEYELYNDENIWLIIKGLLSLLFNNKFIIYGKYKISSKLKENKLPLVELPPEDAYQILYSFTDITFNNTNFDFITHLFISEKRNKINRKELISYIKLRRKYRYWLALIISIIKSCSIIAVFIF